jgi:hypothetical protein
VTRLKLKWAEGRISYGLGELDAAEYAFRQVRDGFEETQQGFAQALVSLETAMVLMRWGQIAEAEELTLEAAAVFKAQEIHREVLGCVLALEEAFRIKKATVGLVERTVKFIREWEMNPDLLYEIAMD